MPERVERYGGDIELVRVAIAKQDTPPSAQVPDFSVHDKSKDPRYRWFVDRYGARCFELDALSPVILRSASRPDPVAARPGRMGARRHGGEGGEPSPCARY